MGIEVGTAVLIGSLISGGAAAAQMLTAKKPGALKTPGAPPTAVEGPTDLAKKPRKYRPAAQIFNDELRLGGGGKLGV